MRCAWCGADGARESRPAPGSEAMLCLECARLNVEAAMLRAAGGLPHEFSELARRVRIRMGKDPGPVVKSPAELELERIIIRNGWSNDAKEIQEEWERHVKNDED